MIFIRTRVETLRGATEGMLFTALVHTCTRVETAAPDLCAHESTLAVHTCTRVETKATFRLILLPSNLQFTPAHELRPPPETAPP